MAFYGAMGWMLVDGRFRSRLLSAVAMPTPSTTVVSHGLDGIRGLAALWVALFHAYQWSNGTLASAITFFPAVRGGDTAVMIFVGLSGFLIYRSVIRIDSIGGLRHYIVRRFLRIYPVYVVTAITGMALFVLPDKINIARHFISEVLMLRVVGYPHFANVVAWSLFAEVLFYIVLPVFVVAAGRRQVLWVVVALVGLVAAETGAREVGLWKFFGFGVLAHLAAERWRERITPGMAFLLFVAGVGILGAVYRHHDFHRELLLGVAIWMLLVGVTLSPLWERIMGSEPLRFLGTISYSVFLWHSILFAFLFDVTLFWNGFGEFAKSRLTAEAWVLPLVILPALVTVGTLSFLVIERPFLAFRPQRSGS